MINKLRGKKLGDEGYIELPSDKKKREKVEDPGEWKAGVSDPGGAKYREWKEKKDAFVVNRRDYEEYQKNPDDTHRLFYVAVTRTEENLFLIEPQTRKAYEL